MALRSTQPTSRPKNQHIYKVIAGRCTLRDSRVHEQRVAARTKQFGVLY
jgi:hypothetical protein